MTKIRIGIDFGYGYTGLAVLASGGGARLRVIKHRNDISEKLLQRRENRSARRRNKTRAARLRNFRVLLSGLGLSPRDADKKPDTDFIGNKLYALAHRRGWDYSTLTELLIDAKGGKTATVREIDKLLIKEYAAPVIAKARRIKGGERVYQTLHNNNKDQTCLGELAQLHADIDKLERRLQKTENPEEAERLAGDIASKEREYQQLTELLENADREEIERYLHKRLEVCGIAQDKRGGAVEGIIVRLGLDSGGDLHKAGHLYTPHHNRHRDEFVRDLRDMLSRALEAEPQAAQKLADNAKKRKITTEAAKALWIKNAVAIMDPNNPARKNNKGKRRRNRDIRPPKFDNRRIGKCPAKISKDEKRASGALSNKLANADIERCWCNLPKKSNPVIRRLQFEAEARQMNIKDGGGERKLTNAEVAELISCVDWRCKQNGKPIPKIDRDKWDKFFAMHKTPPIKDDARGKRDILKDIAEGAQSGRTALCKAHLCQKLQLIKDGQTESEQWQNLHGERRLNIYDNDGAPSVRQKVQKVIGVLKLMLRDAGYGDSPPIAHIGIETARFDISALAQNEGKKMKTARRYQQKSGRDLADLCAQQGERCLYCGGHLGREATIDHFIAKARRGSDREKNRVAAHRICNINKGARMAKPNDEVLRLMEEKGGDAKSKAQYLRKITKDGGASSGDSLAGAQHTMLGAKLLKGSLISAFGISAESAAAIFPPVMPAEVSQLRRVWFPLMNAQKRDIRLAAREGNSTEYKGQPIETFHHAIDAVICAAKVNWQTLTRISGNPGSADYMRRFMENAKAQKPPISLPTEVIGEVEYQTAPEEHTYLITDKGDKHGTRRAKTGREPLNCKTQGEVRQRKALYAIAKKNLNRIIYSRMRGLMTDAFAAIESLPKEERDRYLSKDGCITQEYFLALPKNHPLHPTKARGALCKVVGTGGEQMWAVVDKKSKALHYFKREVSWHRAVVYTAGDNNKMQVARVPEKFYDNRINARLFSLPQGARIIKSFRRGDIVIAEGKSGKWKITKLANNATLTAADDNARREQGDKATISAAYDKLTKAHG